MIPARRKSILALLGCAATAAALVPLYALAAPNPSKAPDLRADPAENIVGPGIYADTEAGLGANRLLVRFDGFVTNIGDGPLEIRGNPQLPQTAAGGVKQYALAQGQIVGDVPSEAVGTPEVTFETADSHEHFHLMRVMRYSLWNLSQTAMVAPAQKVGFCLYDLQTAPSLPTGISPDPFVYTGSVTHFCEWKQPLSTSLRMGVSSGRRDVYDQSLAYQWVDVSATAPGTYLVASEADPDNVIWEGGGVGPETNVRAFASKQVTVPGYVARPVTVAQGAGAQQIPLQSIEFGNAGPVAYTLADPPAHGTAALNASTGVVTYTPDPGYGGPDGFTYTARDQNSDFPTAGSEPEAAVTITGATPTIAISGAPASLIAGTSAQLSATLANAGGGVTWSVSAGTISPSGLFVAPSTPPPGGTVTVRATSTQIGTLSGQVVIAITPTPVSQPAPQPPPATTTSVPRKFLSKMTLTRGGGRSLVATLTTGKRAGRVTITMVAVKRGIVLGRCGARVLPNKTVSCRIVVPRGYPLAKVRATATIAFGGKVSAVRRAMLIRP